MKDSKSPEPIFREEQRFDQLWVWTVVVVVAVISWRLAWKHHLFRWPLAIHSKTEVVLFFFWLLFGIGLPLFIFCCRLITEVREDGIFIRFVPFHRTFQKISFHEFKRYEMRVYRPMPEYGGWGIRFGSKSRAYNLGGDRGIEFTFVDGRKVLIGSQHVRELLQAIHSQCAQQREK